MMRVGVSTKYSAWVACAALVAVLNACGGQSGGEGSDSGEGSGGAQGGGAGGAAASSAVGGSTSVGGATGSGVGGAPFPDPSQECDAPGEERPAVPTEPFQECVCADHGYWQCYGPDHAAPLPPPVECSFVFVGPADGMGSCLVMWSECSDGRIYSISCVSEVCFCIEDGDPTVELKPRDNCPEDLADFNLACGWSLRRPR